MTELLSKNENYGPDRLKIVNTLANRVLDNLRPGSTRWLGGFAVLDQPSSENGVVHVVNPLKNDPSITPEGRLGISKHRNGEVVISGYDNEPLNIVNGFFHPLNPDEPLTFVHPPTEIVIAPPINGIRTMEIDASNLVKYDRPPHSPNDPYATPGRRNLLSLISHITTMRLDPKGTRSSKIAWPTYQAMARKAQERESRQNPPEIHHAA